jgi:hypothetical protein
MTLAPSDAMLAANALSEAAAAHSHESTGPDDTHEQIAERYRTLRSSILAALAADFPHLANVGAA